MVNDFLKVFNNKKGNRASLFLLFSAKKTTTKKKTIKAGRLALNKIK